MTAVGTPTSDVRPGRGGLAGARCFRHTEREAVARCPECGRFYCRECITEHQGRVICAGCLGKLTRRADARGPGLRRVARGLQVAAGCVFLVVFFFIMGQLLLTIPSDFHEGTLWRESSTGGQFSP